MTNKKIVLYDDEAGQAAKYHEQLSEVNFPAEHTVESVEDELFFDMLGELNSRRKAHLKKETYSEKKCLADHTDIFIVDFLLLEAQAGLNGEEVAYNILCFSDCKYIVLLNRFGLKRTFDLTLRGHLDSWADLNISSQDVGKSELWIGENRNIGYRPWHWPNLLAQAENAERRVADVKRSEKKRITEMLKMPEHILFSLPTSIGQMLGAENEEEVTIDDFFRNSKLAMGERKEDSNFFSTDRKAKISASRLSKWLEYAVLPGQNVLVDAPHLAYAYPSLLTEDPVELENWNKTTQIGNIDDVGLNEQHIKEFAFSPHWLSRKAWYWQDAKEEVRESLDRPDMQYVFAEDSSSFYKETDCRSFITNVDSPNRRRYIKRFSDVDYQPLTQLLKE